MDCPEQSPQDNYEPMPTYNLWARSPFYREREFIPRHFYTMTAKDREGAQSSFPSEEKKEIVRDSSNRRIIQKDSLYTNPDLFNEPVIPSKTIFAQMENRQWTDSFWRRAGLSLDNELRVADKRKKGKGKEFVSRPFKKNFMDALAQPLKSSKAESMMLKMGWQGGALGRGGNGIVEPITPNIDYAQRTIGFGQCTDSPKTIPRNMSCKKNLMKKAREIFITNTLLHILEFVRNDWENEIIFDSVLTNKERAIVHQCVNDIINSDDEVTHHQVRITTHQQMRALTDIRQYNTYVLCTVSLGAVPMRQLNLYKEAPEHVYLVTPEDFDDEVEVIEDNPFLKSIRKSLDSENVKESGDRGKLMKFFVEFIRDDSFTEFRFLGPFSAVQAECLSLFVGDVSEAITGDDDDDDGTVSKLRRLFADEGVRCELVDNCNGSMVIQKHKEEKKT